jgi:hypothetical protein
VQELAAIVKSKKANEEYVVVDVRDDDFRGGNIVGAHNAPSRSFSDAVTTLAEDTRNVPLVVFHCMLSKERGPRAARVRARPVYGRAHVEQTHRFTRRRATACKHRARTAPTRCACSATASAHSRQSSRCAAAPSLVFVQGLTARALG